jgi:hypothetical protein
MIDALEYEAACDVLERFAASGFDIDRLVHDDLAPIDEFHMGARAATECFLGKMNLTGREHALDVGSSLGGPARFRSS